MMKRCVIFELKRAFESVGTKISILIGSVIVLLDLLTFYLQYGAPGGHILIQAWIGTDFQFAYNGLFYIVYPILACLPFAGSYYQDVFSGYDKNICIRISRKQYMIAKCFAVYVSAFVCTIIPLLGNLFIAAGLYPDSLPEKLNFLSAGVIDCDRFPVLFSEHPLAYCMVFILVDGLFAGALGLVSVAVMKYCKSQFSAVMTPFVLYILTGLFMLNESGRSIAVMEMVNPIQRYTATVGQMCAVYLFIVLASIIVIWFCGRKRDIL